MRYKRPANPRINFGHPLAQNLIWCVVAGPGGSGVHTSAEYVPSLIDLVNGLTGVTGGGFGKPEVSPLVTPTASFDGESWGANVVLAPAMGDTGNAIALQLKKRIR
jgi:hypothetical protein